MKDVFMKLRIKLFVCFLHLKFFCFEITKPFRIAISCIERYLVLWKIDKESENGWERHVKIRELDEKDELEIKLQSAETAKAEAETAKANAETAKVEAEAKLADAEKAKTEAEAKAIIIELDKSAKKEDKFAELAKTKSADATAQNGGYLGKVPADKLVPEFTAAAKALAKNTYSKTPVKTEFGYHIIFLKDKTAPKALTYAEVEPKISQILIGNAFSKKIKELTDELKKDAKIVIK